MIMVTFADDFEGWDFYGGAREGVEALRLLNWLVTEDVPRAYRCASGSLQGRVQETDFQFDQFGEVMY